MQKEPVKMNKEQLEPFSTFNRIPLNLSLYLSSQYKREEIQLF